MTVREDAERVIAGQLYNKRLKELVFSDIANVVQNLSAQDKARLVQLFVRGNPGRIGDTLYNLVITQVRAEALQEAQALLADNSLDLTDLQRIFL